MEKKILQILLEIRPDGEFLQSENFISDGLLDSFDMVVLVSELDKFFKISIGGEDIIADNFKNLKTIKNLLHSYNDAAL